MSRTANFAAFALLAARSPAAPPLSQRSPDPWKTHSRAVQTDAQRPKNEIEARRAKQRREKAARRRQR